ncbi:hypothetical protein FWF48_00620 [Candidatus Saccharibacteria bacterium]|nr:hypothetical protein [Candidatus Saccharibacteria bacterium]
MSKDVKTELSELVTSLDEDKAEKVLSFVKKLDAPFVPPDEDPNDFAVAKLLNDALFEIADAYYQDEANTDTSELNDCFTLLAHKLKELYMGNATLLEITPESIGNVFDILHGNERTISEEWEYRTNKVGSLTMSERFKKHTAEANRLWLIHGKKPAKLNTDTQKILDDSATAVSNYLNGTDGYKSDWYELTYEQGRRLYINSGYELTTTKLYSTPAELLDQAFKHPNELFKPSLSNNRRHLTSILNDMGFKGEVRKMFFPIVSKNEIKFRPHISRPEIEREKINTSELDDTLRQYNGTLRKLPKDEWNEVGF